MFKRLLLAGASLLAMTVYAHADPVTIGSIIISSFLNTGLGALLPTVSAAAIGSGTLAAGQLALSVGLSLLSRPKAPPPGTVKQTIRTEETPAYNGGGRGDMPTVLVFGNTDHPYIYRWFVHLVGPIDYVETYYINGREVIVDDDGLVLTPPYVGWSNAGWVITLTSSVTILEKDGADTDTVWEPLNTAFPLLITEDHILPGIAQTLMIITSPGIAANPEAYQLMFSAGPELEFIKRGRLSKIYDPRLDSTNGGSGAHRADDPDTWEWSENGVLNAVDIHRKINPHFTDTKYDWALVAQEADKADVEVTIPGGTEPRSRFGGAWAAEGSRNDTFKDVMDSVGVERRITDENKYWFELIDDTRDAEIAFTADDGYSVSWAPGPKAIERPNIARVKYLSPERNFKVEELPLHRLDTGTGTYIGGEWARNEAEIDAYGEKEFAREYPYCPSAYQAQRNLRREFAMARGDMGDLVADMSGWAAWGCHVASIDIDGVAHVSLIDAPRANDEPGRVSIPFTVIPDLEPMVADDYVPPAPDVADVPIDAEIGTPTVPTEATIVQYPSGGAYEIRIRFDAVTNGDRYLPIMRGYISYDDQPERWRKMDCLDGVTIGVADADSGDIGGAFDFRYLASNGGGTIFSDYGPPLEIDDTPGLQIDNTAPSAPSVVETELANGVTLDATVTELRVVKMLFEHNYDGAGWSTGSTLNDVRPEEERTVTMSGFTNATIFDKTLLWRVSAFTSNDTQGAYTSGSVTIPGNPP